MTGQLRVFISSTMRDLVNERDAVVAELRRLNFDPVNAEAILPTGGGSWEVIDAHIAQCDVFVLIMGESYGWIPTSGPHAGEGKSATELEYLAARRRGVPVLPFVKRLEYGTPQEGEQARLRDRFRADVEAWEDGQFRTDFDLARDLAEKVGKAINLFLAANLRELGERRRTLNEEQVPKTTTSADVADPSPASGSDRKLVLPSALVEAVANRSALLFAGAGMSIQAGLPSAYAFTEHLLAKIAEVDPEYARGAHGGTSTTSLPTWHALSA